MTFNWYDLRASTWYEGYLDSHASSGNTGNFINLKSLEGTDQYAPALQAVTNNLIGLFESKGVTSAQAQSSPEFQQLLDLAKAGNTKEAFQGGASAVTSARDRGDLWGADVSEGGEQGFGKSYLEDVAAGKITNASVQELYETGLLRDPKTAGLDYWEKELDNYYGMQYLQEVIAGDRPNATIEDLYRRGLQKTGNQEGLDYWGERLSNYQGIEYLKAVEQGDHPNATIADLYSKGLNRTGKPEGMDYWQKELDDKPRRDYLESVAAGKQDSTIEDLFIKGLGREGKSAGINYWKGELSNRGIEAIAADFLRTDEGKDLRPGMTISEIAKSFQGSDFGPSESIEQIAKSFQKDAKSGLSLQDIAKSFLLSDEAMIQDVYHQQYGRMAEDEGLNYWQQSNEASASGISDAQNLLNVITYRGDDLDGDGVITAEERAASEHKVSAETGVRDDMQNLLGLVSNEENRESMLATDAPFTAATNADVSELVNYIRNSADPSAASVNANTLTSYLAHVKDALNLGNVDDSGDQATHMGQFGTKEEVKAMLDAYVGTDTSVSNLDNAIATGNLQSGTGLVKDQTNLNEIATQIIDKTGQETWGALTEEETKTADDVWVPWTNPFGATYTGQHGVAPTLSEDDAKQIVQPENLELWKKHGAFQNQPTPTPTQGTDTQDWSLTPTKPNLPTPLPINRSNVDYLTVAGSDVQDTSGYGQAKTQFDKAMSSSQPQGGTATAPKVGKRLIDTSAQGVRRKRSQISTSGKSLGTQAFNRSQINSLNI